MSDLENLPEEARSKLDTDVARHSADELLPAEVAALMYDHDEYCIWSTRLIQSELPQRKHQDTISKKLDKLEEVRLVRSQTHGTGDIYWWNYPETDYPLPPDVDVEPDTGISVRDVIKPYWAKLGLLGVFLALISTLPLVIGLFGAVGAVPGLPDVLLLETGIGLFITAYSLLLYASAAGAAHYLLPKDRFDAAGQAFSR